MGQEWDETCVLKAKSVLWDGILSDLEIDALPTELRSCDVGI